MGYTANLLIIHLQVNNTVLNEQIEKNNITIEKFGNMNCIRGIRERDVMGSLILFLKTKSLTQLETK
jgi:hypothetical protein